MIEGTPVTEKLTSIPEILGCEPFSKLGKCSLAGETYKASISDAVEEDMVTCFKIASVRGCQSASDENNWQAKALMTLYMS